MSTIANTIEEIARAPRPEFAALVEHRWNTLTKPRGSLGVLEQAVAKLAVLQGTAEPNVEPAVIYIFCGDHGITEEGVSAYPSAVTRQMTANFVRGGAAINVLCRQHNIDTRIVDAGIAGAELDAPEFAGVLRHRVGAGTANFLKGPAMSRLQAEQAIVQGIALARGAAQTYRIAGAGEMGIGNTTAASALVCAFTGLSPNRAAGRGAGLSESGVLHKVEVLRAALALHRTDPDDPLSILSAFGGFEIAMMAGFFLGAAAAGMPAVVDGFISGAAFLAARAFHRPLADHVFFAHRSAEPGHAGLLAEVGAAPLLDLGLCLGEGTGAALALGVLASAVRLYSGMATFSEASVSGRTKEQQSQ